MYLKTQNIDKIVKHILASQKEKNELIWLMFAEKSLPEIPQLMDALNKAQVRFFGGFFPKLIYNNQSYDEGVVIQSLPSESQLFTIYDLDQQDFDIPEFSEESDFESALILVDGLTSHLNLFLLQLYNRLGNAIHCFGGGAGSLSLNPQPCLITNEGFFQDAAILVFMPQSVKLGVRHGWQVLEGPFLVNESDKNTIRELNWTKAFDIYKNIIERNTQQIIQEENFFELSKNFPFGISKYGSEYLIRDPIRLDSKMGLVCVGEVPENVTVSIMKGDKNSLIEAAQKAAEDSLNVSEGHQASSFYVFDCISRSLYLDDDFQIELQAVCETAKRKYPDIIPCGALTLGEIASNHNGYLEFLNKTIVTSLLYDLE
jgi:hypothetical protein